MSSTPGADITLSHVEVRAFKHLLRDLVPQVITNCEVQIAETKRAIYQARNSLAANEVELERLENQLIALRTAHNTLERMP